MDSQRTIYTELFSDTYCEGLNKQKNTEFRTITRVNTEKQVGASDSAEYVQAKPLICRGGHSLRKMNLIFTTVKLLVNVKP